ncbi:sensor histidine kinase [Enterococcus thailandicus]|uniref:sensor histidine kinase n=1 Tax=Enterococcus thailandicus TaxID=417368 RepID=UPI0009001E97|nr:GHKL domain-containing protein [Enterococcus thailandicus]
MNSILQIFSFLITGLTMTIVVFDFFNELFKKKYENNFFYFICYFLFYIGFLVSMLIPTPIIRIFFPAVFPFIFGAFLYSNFSFPLTLFLLIAIEFCEITIESLTDFIFGGGFLIMPSNLLRNLIIFFLYQFIMLYIKNKKQNFSLPKRNFAIFILPLLSLIIINLSTLFTIQSQDFHLVVISTIVGTGLLFSNIFMFYLFKQLQVYSERENLYRMKSQQSKLQYQYVKDLESKNLETKKILHDIKRHLAVLSTLKDTQDSPEYISNYINQINLSIDSVEITNYTDSPIVNLLINNKKNIAKENEINYTTRSENISFDFMEEIDQTTLFSNILDNAFEEAAIVTSSNKFVSITICTINDFKIVNISNSYDPDNHKNNKNHMGLGLHNVQDVARKYQANLTIDDNKKQGIFEVQLSFL